MLSVIVLELNLKNYHFLAIFNPLQAFTYVQEVGYHYQIQPNLLFYEM